MWSDDVSAPHEVLAVATHFLVEPFLSSDNLTKLSSFAVTKFLDSMIGTGLDVRRFCGTSFIIKSNTLKQAKRLLALTPILFVPVNASLYDPLNTCKGIVRSPVLKYMFEEHIVKICLGLPLRAGSLCSRVRPSVCYEHFHPFFSFSRTSFFHHHCVYQRPSWCSYT